MTVVVLSWTVFRLGRFSLKVFLTNPWMGKRRLGKSDWSRNYNAVMIPT
ncbi:hypothetical protein Plhal304r1_c045g0125481 [Plasmopara halstedii]